MTSREMAAFNMGMVGMMLFMTITQELSYNTTAWYILHCDKVEQHPITVAEAREGIYCRNGAGIEPLKDTETRMKLAKYQIWLVWERTKEKLNLTQN